MIIKALRDRGVSLQKIRKSVDSIKKHTDVENPLSQLRVACLANRVLFKKGDNYLEISGQADNSRNFGKSPSRIAPEKHIRAGG